MTVIIDYKAGNTRSVMNLLDRMSTEYKLTDDIEEISKADRLILPGVGHAQQAMEALQNLNLVETIKSFKKPFLGICLGMQLMYEHSEEGNTTCLGLVPGKIGRFSAEAGLKVPHMGWNDTNLSSNQIFENLKVSEHLYFVHSYFAELSDITIASCDYGPGFSAAIQYRNFFGLQFHPEKSSLVGQKMVENFLKMKQI